MLHLLLSDVQRPPRSLFATGVSVVLHAGVVVALVITGQRVATAVATFLEETVQFLYPAPRDTGPLKPGLASEAAPRDARTTGDAAERWRQVPAGLGGAGAGVHEGIIFAPLTSDAASVAPGVGDNAYSAVEVDSTATFDAGSAVPEYPEAMARRRVEGSALLRFVIDSTGCVDMTTVRVVNSTHSAFAKAVIAAMPKMKYRPASIAGQPVRLLVEQAFTFRIQKSKGTIS
jgi:TonB family protein